MKGYAFVAAAMMACAGFHARGAARADEPQSAPGRPAPTQLPLQVTPFQLNWVSAVYCVEKLKPLLAEDPAVVVMVDEPTNTVFIRASAETTEKAKAILHRLEAAGPTYLWAFQLKHADATRTAKRLTVLLGENPDVHVTADDRTNSLILHADRETSQKVRKILKWLDAKDK